MTIKELKKIIQDLPDDMKIGGSGHFGEFLECYSISVIEVRENRKTNERKPILSISIEDAGEEPD